MLERNQIYLGNCLEVMKTIPDKSIDIILCDLPYGITRLKWDSVINLEALWIQYKRIIKPKGVIALTASQPFTSQLVMSNPKWFRHELIWDKTKGTNFMQANKMPLKSHENILIFGEGLSVYNPQFTMGKPYTTRGLRPAIHYENKPNIDTISDGRRYPKSIIKFPFEVGLHPAQKPTKLFEWLIKTYTNEGDLVLDNCAGSGTTAIACLNTNRDYILIEKEQKYFDICKERIDKHVVQKTLLD